MDIPMLNDQKKDYIHQLREDIRGFLEVLSRKMADRDGSREGICAISTP